MFMPQQPKRKTPEEIAAEHETTLKGRAVNLGIFVAFVLLAPRISDFFSE